MITVDKISFMNVNLNRIYPYISVNTYTHPYALTDTYRYDINVPYNVCAVSYLTMTDKESLLTVKDIADYLRINALTVYEYIRSGQLRAVKLGRYYRVVQKDLSQFVENHKTNK